VDGLDLVEERTTFMMVYISEMRDFASQHDARFCGSDSIGSTGSISSGLSFPVGVCLIKGICLYPVYFQLKLMKWQSIFFLKNILAVVMTGFNFVRDQMEPLLSPEPSLSILLYSVEPKNFRQLDFVGNPWRNIRNKVHVMFPHCWCHGDMKG
jgi:hypothetical protein